jgi:hypothetical protein
MAHWMKASLLIGPLCLLMAACCHPSVTAVPLSSWNQGEPCGIPFYLPKPLLVITKNVRYIEEAHVGLTDPAPIPADKFDDQSAYGTLQNKYSSNGASTSGSGAPGTGTKPTAAMLHSSDIPIAPKDIPSDGLSPDTFYTYQIIFVPDLSQKYGLRIKGGVGEIRAAMNLVNGWQFTGLGPYYMKDSSTAQNILASGIASNLVLTGVGDVIKDVTDLRSAVPSGTKPTAGELDAQRLQAFISRLDSIERDNQKDKVLSCIANYAEIHVYEPELEEGGKTTWHEVASHAFTRDFIVNSGKTTLKFKDPPRPAAPNPPAPNPDPSKPMTETQDLKATAGMLSEQQRKLSLVMAEKKLGLSPGTLGGQYVPTAGNLGGSAPAVVVNTAPHVAERACPPGPIARLMDCICHRHKDKTTIVEGASTATAGQISDDGATVSKQKINLRLGEGGAPGEEAVNPIIHQVIGQ